MFVRSGCCCRCCRSRRPTWLKADQTGSSRRAHGCRADCHCLRFRRRCCCCLPRVDCSAPGPHWLREPCGQGCLWGPGSSRCCLSHCHRNAARRWNDRLCRRCRTGPHAEPRQCRFWLSRCRHSIGQCGELPRCRSWLSRSRPPTGQYGVLPQCRFWPFHCHPDRAAPPGRGRHGNRCACCPVHRFR